ncbi:MAG TPA: ABC transporter permease [Caulobacteraceae bacterium]|nr:ABC transporter permease [Caulobacteraceae bacterium]
MSWAMFRVMALDLWRDRPALVMTFLLPSVVFLIFSAVFAGATGIDVKLKLAVADLAHTPGSTRVYRAILADPDLRAEAAQPATYDGVVKAVRTGHDDAGLVIRADPAAPGTPFFILADPAREVAAPLTEARARDVLTAATPDVLLTRTVRDIGPALGDLTDDQKQNLEIATEQAAQDPKKVPQTAALFIRQNVVGAKKGGASIAYYAGAVMILFALFAAVHGALTLVDERRAGIADRILAGRHGIGPVVTGKMIFLIVQGVAQAAVIFTTAQVVYGVAVTDHLGLMLVTTVAASASAAGIAMALVALCRTREQAQMLSTFVILILAAIGGSMVPRFLMPPWLQTVGWWTPHAWVIEAYQDLLWRDSGAGDLYKTWLVLTLIGAVGYLVAQVAARRLRT